MIRSGRDPRQGSALLMTVLTVALLLVIVVTFTVQVQMDMKAARNDLEMAKARANARLAVELAIARLQETVGPDQKITARADLLADVAEEKENQWWTAVWSTGDEELDVGANQRSKSLGSDAKASASYLVSGSNTQLNWSPNDLDYPNDNAVRAHSEMGAERIAVTVPLQVVEDDGNKRSRYAYWISDEGVKAKFTMHREKPENPDALELQKHYLAPSAMAADLALSDAYQGSFSGLSSNDLSKVLGMETLNLAMDNAEFAEKPDGLAQAKADLTPWSYGVLADVRHGGLKKDLTAAFEDDASSGNGSGDFAALLSSHKASQGNSGQKENVWWSQANASLAVPDGGSVSYGDLGLRWASLYYFYNYYKASMPHYDGSSSGSSPAGIGGTPGSAEVEMRCPVVRNVWDGGILGIDPIAPRLIGISSQVSLSSDRKANGNYNLRLHYQPRMLLFNPYNVRIKGVRRGPQGTYFAYYGDTFYGSGGVTFSTNGVDVLDQEIPLPFNIGNGTFDPAEHRFWPIGTVNQIYYPAADPIVFEPGEVKAFALDRNYRKTAGGYYTNPTQIEHFIRNEVSPSDFDLYTVSVPLTDSGTLLDEIEDLAPNVRVGVETPVGVTSAASYYQLIYVSGWPHSNSSDRSDRRDVSRTTLLQDPSTISKRQELYPGGIEVSSLDGTKKGVMHYVLRAKGLQAEQTHRLPGFHGNSEDLNFIDSPVGFDLFDITGKYSPDEPDDTDYNYDVFHAGDDELGSYFFHVDAGRLNGLSSMVLRELPVQPMVSIGQFMHHSMINNFGYRKVDNKFGKQDNLPLLHSSGSTLLGGSLPNPALADQLEDLEKGGSTSFDNLRFDHHYLNNRALFDRYFFSTIPPAYRGAATTYPEEWGSSDKYNVGDRLLNPRHVYAHEVAGSGKPTVTELRSVNGAASGLLVDGAFNVNSVSVRAWQALFASLRYDPSDAANSQVPRFTSILSGADTAEDHDLGLRVLDPGQVEALAVAMVSEVKGRGPFLSMADFVNRRRSSGEFAEKGALQAAIDKSGINQAALSGLGTGLNLNPGSDRPSGPLDRLEFMNLKGDERNTALGAAGVIMQGDFLQALAPFLSVRSDTFVIRAYGDSGTEAADTPAAKAWCEVVVQRLPSFVDERDEPWTDLVDASDLNKSLGRGFRVLAMRWLNEDEI